MTLTHAWGAASAGARLGPMTIERREPGAHDVELDVLYCGVCHSDIHQARDEWGGSIFPMVPGHEIIGRVVRVGASVTKLAVGDLAGVGCMVDSCRKCRPCEADVEQFCERRPALTYNGTEMDRKTPTFGGYSKSVVVTEHFALRIPSGLDPAAAAPLLCAGITTYSPLRQARVNAGARVGVVGLGGLGHMAVKLARSMGAEVTVLSSSPSKEADALRLGAHHFAVAGKDTFKSLRGTLDVIIDSVSAPHDYNDYLRLLRAQGSMMLVGAPTEVAPIAPFSLIGGGKSLVGSSIGGIAETQEMLEHCAAHDIVADIEMIPMNRINEAYERMLKSDVRYRFVIDLATLA